MRYRQRGLTLIELMVTLAVAIILVAVGMPLFNNVVENNRATTRVNALSYALQLARSEAVKTGNRAALCPKDDPSPTNLDCGDQNDWDNGWMVYRGVAVGGASVGADNLLRTWEAPTGIEVSTAVSGLTFNGTGALESVAATQTLTLRVVGCATGAPLQRQLTITPIGQVQTTRSVCP